MSRVDEALRRASVDMTSVHAPVAVDPPAIAVDGSALDMYTGEQRAAPRRTPDARPPVRPTKPSPPPPVRHAALHASLEGKAVISRETSPVSIEQYRRLATALHAVQAERGLKTLMISSAVPHDGKTLTVTNLALTLSDSYGRRVLLIDADFRRPCIHELFGLMNVGGLADALHSSGGRIQPVPVSPNLSVLPAGQAGGSTIAAPSP